MAGTYTQERRFLELTTALGTDLMIESFTISERLSEIYEIEIDALTALTTKVNPSSLLGEAATIQVRLDPESPKFRYFSGVVREVYVGTESDLFRGFRLNVVPTLWLSTLSQNFRVFEKESVPDILKKILTEYGISPTSRLTRTYTKWDMCTQYRETDFEFMSRVMEEEGIFYFFEHGKGKNTLVLADSPEAFQACPEQGSYNYAPDLGPGDGFWIGSFDATHQLRTGSYRLWDGHLENKKRLEATKDTSKAVAGNTKYKFSDYPGRFTQQFNKIGSVGGAPAEGTTRAKLRLEGVETENPMFRASGSVPTLGCGQKFTLKGSTMAGDYVLTSVQHSGLQFPPYMFGESETDLTHDTTMTCIKSGSTFRPARKHQKPKMYGPQTAIVTDRPDKYGRVRVKYPWGSPEQPSAWVRVVQKWAGPQYGALFIPRPDHEVVVEFIDGDPDQPIITGCVYNSTNMPPYNLPDEFTKSGVKTRSVTAKADGGAEEFNELRFEDKQGKEDIYFHAQKDFHRFVENDDDLKVEHDQTIQIKNHRTEVVKDGNEKITIEKGKREVFVDKGDHITNVKMGNRKSELGMGNEELRIKMGNQTTKIDLGKQDTEAMQSIEFKVGQSSIKIDQMGITLKGMMIKCEAQIQMETKGLINKMDGTAMVQIKGGITMIN